MRGLKFCTLLWYVCPGVMLYLASVALGLPVVHFIYGGSKWNIYHSGFKSFHINSAHSGVWTFIGFMIHISPCLESGAFSISRCYFDINQSINLNQSFIHSFIPYIYSIQETIYLSKLSHILNNAWFVMELVWEFSWRLSGSLPLYIKYSWHDVKVLVSAFFQASPIFKLCVCAEWLIWAAIELCLSQPCHQVYIQ